MGIYLWRNCVFTSHRNWSWPTTGLREDDCACFYCCKRQQIKVSVAEIAESRSLVRQLVPSLLKPPEDFRVTADDPLL